MAIVLDERAVRDELAPCLADAGFARALQNLVGDRLCLSLFLMGVSHGEALGEAGVAAIGLDDVASLMHDLRRQQLEEHGHMAGTRLGAVPRGVLRLDDVEVGAEAMVGPPGGAFPMIRKFFDVNRAMIGLKCVGAAQQTLDETIAYVTGRTQFGASLASFQGVAFPIAEAATVLELGRWHCYRVLWLRQHGVACSREAAMAKWWVPKVAGEIIHQCLLLHGHYGYSRRLPIEQRLRDVIGWEMGDGTAQIQKLIIARSLLGGALPR